MKFTKKEDMVIREIALKVIKSWNVGGYESDFVNDLDISDDFLTDLLKKLEDDMNPKESKKSKSFTTKTAPPSKISNPPKFVTHNDREIDVNGTCFEGSVDIRYEKLVQFFGEPKIGDYKTDAEWEIEFEEGTVATIYNYKDGKNYNGEKGIETKKITDWNIGGKDKRAYKLVKKVINQE